MIIHKRNLTFIGGKMLFYNTTEEQDVHNFLTVLLLRQLNESEKMPDHTVSLPRQYIQ